MKGQGFARQVTPGTLKMFGPLLRKKHGAEHEADGSGDEANSQNGISNDPAFLEAEALFQGESIRNRIPFTRKRKPGERIAKKNAKGKKNAAKASTPASKPPVTTRGQMLWRKKLAASDCERQPGHGTGGVRLTQARFKVNGRVIDQTTYFRNLFAGFHWVQTNQIPFVERADVPFHIRIRNRNYGIRTLAVNHKPSGEAGQGNQTSDLKWTGMTEVIRKLNLTGSDLILYGPAPGTTEPFFVEVI